MSAKLFICLPVLNESEQLPDLIECLVQQTYQNFKLIICINQPDEWWENEKHIDKCLDNQKSMEILTNAVLDIELIDKSSKGKAWIGKKSGVGWARKLTMEKAALLAEDKDLIVSVDADTYYPEDYFHSLINLFSQNTHFTAHSNPYYHPLTGFEAEDRAILRYEIYMRVFHINMMLIENPYAFSALGSAMACTAAQYKKMGGISPKLSGEDFYFIQHMRKNGPISQYNTVKVYPQARFSDRVNFGTGPAMIKGNSGDWTSYPFYLPRQFQDIRKTFELFPHLFEENIETPMSDFLQKQLKKVNPWQSLKENYKTSDKFEHACMQLVDGLRILQFLKSEHLKYSKGDILDLLENLEYFSSLRPDFALSEFDDQSYLSIDFLKELRDRLENLELSLRFEKRII